MTDKQILKQLKQTMKKEVNKNSPPSKKFGFTKFLLVNVLLMNYILLGFALLYMWVNHDGSMFDRLQIVWGTELATITGFYVWKAKNENQLKIKGFYDMKLNEMNIESDKSNMINEFDILQSQYSKSDFYSANDYPYDNYVNLDNVYSDVNIDNSRYSDNI